MIEQEELVRSATRYALRWLNSMGNPLPEDYITGARVMYDSGTDPATHDMERIMLMEMESDDDGGPSMMFIHFDLNGGQINFAAWYFDGEWSEMKGVSNELRP